MSSGEVKHFYDDFMRSRMLNYRVHGNLRLEKAIARILPEIQPHHRILDIGCGIGIVSERIAAAASKGRVWGIDLSERNIWYAKQTVARKNLSLFVADVIEDFATITQHLQLPVDVVSMVDVIEHIPQQKRRTLFSQLRQISNDNALLILTYPSPQYQRYLAEHDPGALQIIDNVIELHDLIEEASSAGYSIRHYSLETVWHKNEYVHCVLQTDDAISPREVDERNWWGKITRRVSADLNRLIYVPWRRKKYITRVFGKED
ncbi:MAG: class I SAM-dependent methyltransferase [Candidatus Binatia bacterium]